MKLLRQILSLLTRSLARKSPDDWKVVLVCLALGTTIWLLNALNKDYTTKMAYPIELRYDPRQLVAVAELPSRVRINVSGYGWNLFKKSLWFNNDPLVIEPANLPERQYITAAQLYPLINEQMRDLRLNYVVQDTLFLQFDHFQRRRVSVVLDSTTLSFAQGFYLEGRPLVIPDSVLFEGPAQLVNAIADPLHVSVPEQNLRNPYNEIVPLPYPAQPLLSVQPNEVRIKFQVAEYETFSQQVPLVVTHLPAQGQWSLSDSLITVYYDVRRANGSFPPDSFRVTADFRRLNRESIVPVELEYAPGEARNVTLQPTSVQVLNEFPFENVN